MVRRTEGCKNYCYIYCVMRYVNYVNDEFSGFNKNKALKQRHRRGNYTPCIRDKLQCHSVRIVHEGRAWLLKAINWGFSTTLAGIICANIECYILLGSYFYSPLLQLDWKTSKSNIFERGKDELITCVEDIAV